MEQIYEYTIKLLRYVLNGDVPQLNQDIDFEDLYGFSQKHGIENIMYVGLRDLEVNVPGETMLKFEEAYKGAIVLEAMQAIELETISDAFEKAGIDHIPLKGSVVKYLYPDPSYRKSGDIDILVRNVPKEIVNEIMFGFEYQTDEDFEHYEVHYGYEKPPFYEVEIHVQLLKSSNRAYKFCSNVWEYTKLKNGSNHCYEMTNEFLYIHLLAHLCNHLYMGGAGIKILMDFYVVRNELSLDENTLDKYLKKTKLADINEMVIKLMDKWFGNSYVEDENIELLEKVVFENGSFGTKEQKEKFRVNDSFAGRLQVLFRKIFLRKAILIKRYEALQGKNYPWIIMWLYRVYYALRYRRKNIKRRVEETFSDKHYEEGMENIIKAIKER